jgi:hypothetical protein
MNIMIITSFNLKKYNYNNNKNRRILAKYNRNHMKKLKYNTYYLVEVFILINLSLKFLIREALKVNYEIYHYCHLRHLK